MRVVTGNKYPDDRWIVIGDNDEVIFDPAYSAGDVPMTLKVCNIYVNMPEHRGELHEKFGRRTDYGWDNDNN